MNRALKNEAESRRQALAIKSMYFNRFLMVRYITAFFFFLFLNWLLAMYLVNSVFIAVPALFLSLAGIASFEQLKLYSAPKNNAKLSSLCYKILLGALLLLSASLFTPLYAKLFPFLNTTSAAKQAIVFLLVLAILLTLTVLARLNKIKNGKDKQLRRILALQAVLN